MTKDFCRRTLAAVFFAVLLGVTPEDAAAGSGIMNADFMTAKAQRMSRFCSGYWNDEWLGSKRSVRSYPAFQLSGTDLAFYRSNSEPMVSLLFAEVATAAQTGKVDNLKNLMVSMADKNHFSQIARFQPKTWEGTVPSWLSSYNSLAEPVYHAALFLVAAAQAYAILEPHLTRDEKALLKKWGTGIFKNAKNARDGSAGKAYDRRAAKAAGFTAWGAATGDQPAYRAGVSLFKSVVAHINKDGSDDYFTVSGHKGNELKYLNMTYGHLSIAAAIMESRGDVGFGYRRRGGSLADGLNYLISRSLNPASRSKIARNQKYLKFTKQARHVTSGSWSFMELAALSGVVRQSVPDLEQALRVRGSRGFYGGHHGGYTSCLFGN